MSLIPPINSLYVEDEYEQRKLTFDYPKGTDIKLLPKTGDYTLVGSISFPRYASDGYYGYAMLAIKSTDNDNIYIIEERKFETIDNVIDNDSGQLKKLGFSSFYEYLKDRYLWNKFYCHHDREITKRYARQMRESKFINEPKPIISNSYFDINDKKDYEKCINNIYDVSTTNKLFFNKNLTLAKRLVSLTVEKPSILPQPIEALSYILMALEYKY